MGERFIILLADDDPNDRKIFRLAMKRVDARVKVLEVSDGEEVLCYLKGEGKFSDRNFFPFPDLLVLDAKMSRMDGLQVLRWLRAQMEFSDLRTVVLSGTDVPGEAKAVKDLGVRYFRKPGEFDEIFGVARQLVERRLNEVRCFPRSRQKW